VNERGMILVNVLLFVAVASGVVMLMISREDVALQRATMMREAARAQAIARGGEASVITALRRDALLAPDNDNASEPWAQLAERGAPIGGGSFDLVVADAQGRFNVNALRDGNAGATLMLDHITRALQLPPELAMQATELVRLYGPVWDLRPLRLAGLDAATLARLTPLLTALPKNTPVNLNSADEAMLSLLVDDPVAVRALVDLRRRQGYLTSSDFLALKVTVPPGAGFTSSYFWVRTRVRIGDTSQQLTSLLFREHGGGEVTVRVVARWLGAAAPEQAPPLPAPDLPDV
jgi:general secretion pathway protein K